MLPLMGWLGDRASFSQGSPWKNRSERDAIRACCVNLWPERKTVEADLSAATAECCFWPTSRNWSIRLQKLFRNCDPSSSWVAMYFICHSTFVSY